MRLIERYRMGHLDAGLSALQIVAFFGFAALVIIAVLLYRHFTDDALVPALDYMLSIKLAFPPILVLGTTYLYAFITGEPVAEAPKSMWSFMKNKLLQSRRFLLGFAAISLCACLGTAALLARHVPPAYGKLVTVLLSGSNDDHQLIKDAIRRVREADRRLSERLEAVVRVFEERRLLNAENKTPTTFLARVLIRQLEDDPGDPDWSDHPLRRMAHAESHSMLAQALTNQATSASTTVIEQSRKRAIEEYELVIADKSSRTTELMRRSAKQNIGNVHYYSGQVSRAIEVYGSLSDKELDAGTEANRVAALVSGRRTADAISVGNRAIARLQANPAVFKALRDYVGLLTNTGFANLVAGQSAAGLEDMQAAFDLIPDTMAKQNLALAQIAMGLPLDALATLELDIAAPAVTPESQMAVVTRNPAAIGSCSYLIRALALAANKEDAANVAANIHSYARRPLPSAAIQLRRKNWRIDANNALKRDKRPCGDLRLLPFVATLIT
jgi:tetratricopeptide (TPR) repeat protein